MAATVTAQSLVHYWESALLPLLEAREPQTVIEVGSHEGENTRRLAEWAREHGALVHAIDPKPQFDTAAYVREWEGHLAVHEDLSLEALPAIGPADMVLIDGDHNWYTVFNELSQLDEINDEWPLVAMHDVGWPWGRRDMYYAPDTLPAEYVLPNRRGGALPLRSELAEVGLPQGTGRYLLKAEREGGPRNGVLTAVEDFLGATERDLLLFAQSGFGGLGILAGAEELGQNPGLVRALASIHDPEFTVTISPLYGTREFGEARMPPAGAPRRRPGFFSRVRRRAGRSLSRA